LTIRFLADSHVQQTLMSKSQRSIHLGLLLLLFVAGGLFYWQNTGSAAVPHLLKQMKSPDVHTRIVAMERIAILRVRSRESALDLFEVAIHDSNQEAAATAASALTKTDLAVSRDLIRALIPRLKSAQPQARHGAAVVLGSMGAPAKAAVPSLIETSYDPDALVRERSIGALGLIGIPAQVVVPRLIEALDDPDPYVRYRAAAVFAFSMPSQVCQGAADVFRRHLQDQSMVANLMRIALAQAEDPNQRSKLAAYRHEVAHAAGSDIRSYALRQLAILGPSAGAALPEITESLGDKYALNRYLAAEALGSVGAAAWPSAAALRNSLQDSDPLVRASAAEALKCIEGM
jgi:HEAT repeat protein